MVGRDFWNNLLLIQGAQAWRRRALPQAPGRDFAVGCLEPPLCQGPQVPESPIPVSKVVAGGLGIISQ